MSKTDKYIAADKQWGGCGKVNYKFHIQFHILLFLYNIQFLIHQMLSMLLLIQKLILTHM